MKNNYKSIITALSVLTLIGASGLWLPSAVQAESIAPPTFPNMGITNGTNGMNVMKVIHSKGEFFKPDRRNQYWLEHSAGKVFHFKETHRDEWSVYLLDARRGVKIRLDLHKKTIYYSDLNSSIRPLYRINSAFQSNPIIIDDSKMIPPNRRLRDIRN